MTVVADDVCSLPLEGLAVLLAACPRFQTVVGAEDAAEAYLKVHQGKVDHLADPAPTRSFAIIADDDVCSFEIDNHFKSSGQLVLTFQFNSAADLDPDSADALRTFNNDVGAILREMLERSNTPGPGGIHYWHVTKFTRLVAPALVDEKEFEDQNEPGVLYFEVSFLADWM